MTATVTDNLARLRQWVDSLNRGTPAFTETFAPDATIEVVGVRLEFVTARVSRMR